ncbi:EAL domain-containing protein [Halomonas sp. BM-2019]|uniref:putative bifunctional diguanylate cyclase/phosphodiesterase n=1 Tax=Halomonas sp. BM-2019 TaxID=2811227 RepID=UPI001B3C3177|nr:MAG: EAL domain-containing protein [Halomonas sp. BM-2019]
MHAVAQCQTHDHLVQFYEDEAFLAEVVADYLLAGARAGERLLVLLTPPHLEAVLQYLEAGGLDTQAALASGQLVTHDAESVLATIMRDGQPVEALFERHLLAPIEATQPLPTRAFGELVNLLCAEGNAEAAVRLEALWHAACHRLPLTLLCGYALQHFDRPDDQAAFDAICDHHSHVLPAEPYGRLVSGHQLREVSRLQQQARVLRRETASRQQAEQTLKAMRQLYGEALVELADQALHDDLTGLMSRQHAQQRLARLIAEPYERVGRVAVLHIDIDQLKAINETLGLEMGDCYLYQTAQRIRRCLGSREVVGRLGSDEMMAVLSGFEQTDEVLSIVERLLDWTSQPVAVAGQRVVASCCIGISLFPEHGRTVAELMRHATLARRQAQRLGRRRCQLFTFELLVEAGERLPPRAALCEAMAHGGLDLYYRPLIAARSGQVVAVSAQPRCHPARFAALAPSHGLSTAEEAGELMAIEQWVLGRACRYARTWLDAGLGLRMVVQISPAGLQSQALVDRVDEALARCGLPGEMLELEVSPSGLKRASEGALALLDRLKDRGVRLTVGDVGSDPSLHGHLHRFPVDSIKLHEALTAGCLDDSRCQTILRSVIAMAHRSGLQVGAAGVATRAQADFLRDQGCDLLEGSLWSRMEHRDTAQGGEG